MFAKKNRWNHGQWRIGKTNDYWYVVSSDSSVCPSSGWQPAAELVSAGLCHNGIVGPAPTVETGAAAAVVAAAVEDAVIVTGAGTSAANGRYRRDGSYNDRPMFTAESGLQIWCVRLWTCLLSPSLVVWCVRD